MILSYLDILGDNKRHKVEATVTTDHPASHYGIPVIVLEDGGTLDLQSWVLLNYQVADATDEERRLLSKVFDNFKLMTNSL